MKKLMKRIISVILILCNIVVCLPVACAWNTTLMDDIANVDNVSYDIVLNEDGSLPDITILNLNTTWNYLSSSGYHLSPTTYIYASTSDGTSVTGSWHYSTVVFEPEQGDRTLEHSYRPVLSFSDFTQKLDPKDKKVYVTIYAGYLNYPDYYVEILPNGGSTQHLGEATDFFYDTPITFEIDLEHPKGTIDFSDNDNTGNGGTVDSDGDADESQNVFPTLDENSARMFLGFIYNNSAYKTIDLSDNPEYLLLTGKIQATEYQKKLLAASFLSVLNVSIEKYISDTNYCKEYLLNGLKEELIGQLQDEKTDIIKDGISDIIAWGADKLTNNSSYLMKELGTVMATANTINNGVSAIEFVIENVKPIVYSIMLPLQSELNGRYTYFNSYISLRNSYDKDSETFKILKEYNALAASENNILGGAISWIPGISSWAESIEIIDEWAEYTYLLGQYIHSKNQSCTNCEYNIIQIQCPVDVQIYDNNEDLIAETKNNLIVKDIPANYIENIQLYVFNDIKVIVFKDDAKYHLTLYANEDGTFNYVCSSIDNLGIETKRDITYDIPIKQGDMFNVSPNDISVVLQIDKGTNEELPIPISKTWFDDSPEIVSIYADANINVNTFGTDDYNLGDIVNLIAPNTSNYVFLGWYENENLVEKENAYTFTAKENRTLEAKYTPIVHVESIKLNKPDILFDSIGANEKLIVKLSPAGVTNSTVMWKSSNNAVATVNSNGLVTSTGKGTAIITATTQDGGYTATCEVTVELLEGSAVPTTGVELNTSRVELDQAGDVYHLKADVLPANATNKAVTWVSSNPNVATVSDNGLVTAVSEGSATITVTTEDGQKVATCIVTVHIESSSSGTDGGGSGGSATPTSYTITTGETVGGTITISHKTASEGKTVSITAVPDDGFTLETLSVSDKNGNEIKLTKETETSYTFKMPESQVTVTAIFTETVVEPEPVVLPFDDISQSAWYYGAIKYVYLNHMMQGTAETLFSPDEEMSRAMIATVLYRLENTPAPTEDASFNDVETNKWYTDAIQWAAENNVINGYGNNRFGPMDSVTREQLAVILYNYTASKGISVEAVGDLSAFSDAEATSDWAEEAISWAVGVGLLSGKGNGILDPSGTATRAEVAQMLMNYLTKAA